MKRLGFLMLMLAVALMLGGSALAQNVGDNSVYCTTYFSANNTTGAPEETVRVINDGDTGATLWSAFYVFDDSQELTECCACSITPDGLLSESVKQNLTAAPLTGRIPSRGVIKVISSATSDPTATKPTAGLRAWATHVQATTVTLVPGARVVPVVKGPWFVTETAFADSNLSAGEQALLQNLCYYDALLSGYPCVCNLEDFDY